MRYLALQILILLIIQSYCKKLSPIVIVPGLGGSTLRAKIENAEAYNDCATNSDWYTIWFSFGQALSRTSCFIHNLMLYIIDGEISNRKGVTIEPIDFGGVDGIEYSNFGTMEPHIPYMHDMVNFFEQHGYKRGENLRGATYDFRKAGLKKEMDYSYMNLKNLIEETYLKNDNQKVFVISHSLGVPVANNFLTSYVDQRWKDKFIGGSVKLSGPLLGTPLSLLGICIGPMYDFIPQFLPNMTTPALKTFPSMLWMLPRTNLSGVSIYKENFIQTPTQNINMNNMAQQFLTIINAPVLIHAYDEVLQVTKKSAEDPNVKVFCGFANDTVTIKTIKMPDDTYSQKGEVLSNTMGDGTVPLDSLRACGNFKNVLMKEYQFGGSLSAHTSISSHVPLLNDIYNWINEQQEHQKFVPIQ